ncbi:MAG: MotA/TolQ/ExbB proton channel family protein [Deltaproteobacteria bacterium]|nr:MotA/TolQ/ExbB proton channel family protein [Deltaproteobacteria bacterium]
MFQSKATSSWAASATWGSSEREIDRGIITGLVISTLLIGVGVVASGRGLTFLDPGSIMIVFGGTIGATLVHFSPADLRYALVELKSALFTKNSHPNERITALVDFAQALKRNGPLVLEREARSATDPFLRKALELTVDGQSEDDIRRILETEIRSFNERSWRAVQVFQTMGNYAPAMGLIGTLIGLIQMLGALDNPSTVGPAMAVALVTTFYGAFLANLFFLPIAGKIKNRSEEEAVVKAITVEGAVSLRKEENSIVLEQRLRSFIPLNPHEEKSQWR